MANKIKEKTIQEKIIDERNQLMVARDYLPQGREGMEKYKEMSERIDYLSRL